MTSFIANQVGGVFTPFVAKDKGDIANRAKCAGEQYLNNLQAGLCDVVVIGGAAAVKKSGKLQGMLGKVYDGFAKTIEKIGTEIMKKKYPPIKGTGNTITKVPMNAFQKLAQKLAKLPGPAKAAAAFAAVATPVLAYVHGRQLYRQGQIDQKYTDRAAVERHNTKVLV